MPVIKSAKKKLRQDRIREKANNKIRVLLRTAIKKATKRPLEKNIQSAVKIIDKAAKKNIVHKNKAARLKSKLSKLTMSKSKPKPPRFDKRAKTS